MENASKALLIAGGILISVIILSVLVYMYDVAREMPKAQEQMQEEKELLAFNKKYETYEGEIKGTDVISVTNMAITNNQKYTGYTDYQIKVSVKINNSIQGYKQHYKWDDSEKKVIKKDKETIKVALNNSVYILTDYDRATSSYTDANNIWNEILNPKSGKMSGDYTYIFNNSDLGTEATTKESNWDWSDYWTRTNLASEFKRKKFDCKIEKYHDNGRVAEIYISEKT